MTGYQSKRAAAQDKLAQPAQKPVAWMWRCKPYYDYPNWEVSLKRPADSGRDGNKKTDGYEDVPLYAAPPQPAQKPVAWLEPEWGEKICPEVGYEVTMTDDHPRDLCWIPLVAQRPWVGLTNNELQPIADEYRILFGSWVEDFARAIEAKLKEKNNG